MLDSIENLKPGLNEQILQRFDQVDQAIQAQGGTKLSKVVEAEHEDEAPNKS